MASKKRNKKNTVKVARYRKLYWVFGAFAIVLAIASLFLDISNGGKSLLFMILGLIGVYFIGVAKMASPEIISGKRKR